jgi:uncharacterized protein YlzI (FlbEa/FlbD family)
MPTTRTSTSTQASLPILLLTDLETGDACAVNALQVEAIDDAKEGACITFASGAALTVKEPFDHVVAALVGRRKP